uniref:Uncharacterized protein n=1 Tax=Panagrolaimus sp. ES5 TaxID=591445 RepID=A0AC34FGN1_9BILA
MIYKTNFIQKVNLCPTSKSLVTFGENLEFTVASQKTPFNSFCVEKVKGDFEITKITATCINGEVPVFYNQITKSFSPSILGNGNYTFYISANIELKEACAVNYQLCVPVARLRLLKLYHFFKDEIVLPGYDDLKFTYYIKKIRKNEADGCDIEVQIENPHDVEIEGEQSDFHLELCGTKDINLSLSFVFYPSVLAKTLRTPKATQTCAATNKATVSSSIQQQQPQQSQSTQALDIKEPAAIPAQTTYKSIDAAETSKPISLPDPSTKSETPQPALSKPLFPPKLTTPSSFTATSTLFGPSKLSTPSSLTASDAFSKTNSFTPSDKELFAFMSDYSRNNAFSSGTKNFKTSGFGSTLPSAQLPKSSDATSKFIFQPTSSPASKPENAQPTFPTSSLFGFNAPTSLPSFTFSSPTNSLFSKNPTTSKNVQNENIAPSESTKTKPSDAAGDKSIFDGVPARVFAKPNLKNVQNENFSPLESAKSKTDASGNKSTSDSAPKSENSLAAEKDGQPKI